MQVVTRMEEAQTAFQAGEFVKTLDTLWDELHEASRRRDSERLQAVKVLAEEIGQASAADRRVRKSASHLADTAAAHLNSEPVATAQDSPLGLGGWLALGAVCGLLLGGILGAYVAHSDGGDIQAVNGLAALFCAVIGSIIGSVLGVMVGLIKREDAKQAGPSG
jgi:hypothetical protein